MSTDATGAVFPGCTNLESGRESCSEILKRKYRQQRDFPASHFHSLSIPHTRPLMHAYRRELCVSREKCSDPHFTYVFLDSDAGWVGGERTPSAPVIRCSAFAMCDSGVSRDYLRPLWTRLCHTFNKIFLIAM